jgi:lipopolysaccharide export system protein LptA
MKYLKLVTLFVGISFILFTSYGDAHNYSPSVINLKSCHLNIKADQKTHLNNRINFSGNVQFLYGLANVKTHNVTLIKKKDGSCKLVAHPWNEKKGHY